MSCNCYNSCNSCRTPTTCNSDCKESVYPNEFANLVYITGLDVNLCKKYATFADLLSFREYTFTSGPIEIHTITHNLNKSAPFVVVYDQATNILINPVEIFVVNPNTVRITVSVSSTIFGRVF